MDTDFHENETVRALLYFLSSCFHFVLYSSLKEKENGVPLGLPKEFHR